MKPTIASPHVVSSVSFICVYIEAGIRSTGNDERDLVSKDRFPRGPSKTWLRFRKGNRDLRQAELAPYK